MNRVTSRRPYLLAAAAIAWFGVLLQCYLSLSRATANGQTIAGGLVAYFGYFTVLTNIVVCIALTVPLTARAFAAGRLLSSDFLVGGVAASIAFVAMAYHFLLRHVWHPQGAQLLADVLMHYLVPALFIVYWYVYVRDGSLRWGHPLWWSLYPTAYFLYVLARGKLIGAYPYGFIDVSAIGYARTMQNALGLLIAFMFLGLLFVAIDRAVRRATP